MKPSKTKLILLLAIFVIVAFFVFWKTQQPKGNVTATTQPTPSTNVVPNNDRDAYKGAISTSTNTSNAYFSKKYGVSFLFPNTWHVGDNSLGFGTLQLFNYNESIASKDFSPTGETNKIEAVISDSNTNPASTYYPEKQRTSKEVTVDGRNATIFDVELVGGQKIRTYYVSLPTMSGKYLAISIYGGVQNFHVLDEIVSSLKFAESK